MSTYGVVIPAFQAAETLGELIRRCGVYLYREVSGIVVVDDGSTDKTGEVARASGAHVIAHPVNRGKGAALLTGFAEATARRWDAAITLDADGQHDPRSIPGFIAEHQRTGADIIVGTRARSGSRMPLPRRVSNRLSSAVVSWLAGVRIEDSQSGYRLIARRVWESIPLCGQRYDLESELLIKAGRRGYRIVPFPIETLYGDETSFFHPLRDTARMIRLFWRLFLHDTEHPDDPAR